MLFDEYCRRAGHKKSTLIAKLIKDHLTESQFQLQEELFDTRQNPSAK